MKEKIYEKMKEYGWNLGYNTNQDFEEVYKIHYNFIEGCYDYLSENNNVNLNDISEISFQDMITFMSDFLRAINDIDDTKKIGDSEIRLYNQHNIEEKLSNICFNDTKFIEYKIRNCEFNGYALCELLNSLKENLCSNNWQVVMELDNMIVVRGTDINRNIYYLEIKGCK